MSIKSTVPPKSWTGLTSVIGSFPGRESFCVERMGDKESRGSNERGYGFTVNQNEPDVWVHISEIDHNTFPRGTIYICITPEISWDWLEIRHIYLKLQLILI